MLGYDRHDQQGPWLIRTIIRWIHRDLRVIAWSAIDSYDQTIQVNSTTDR
jgi:hypothetical protein